LPLLFAREGVGDEFLNIITYYSTDTIIKKPFIKERLVKLKTF
jgi:hypothetical protein